MANARQVENMHTPTVPELLAWLVAKRLLLSPSFLWYMAPLDQRPSRLRVRSKVKTFKNPHRFAVSVEAPGLRFRIDEGHLDRIYVPDGWGQG